MAHIDEIYRVLAGARPRPLSDKQIARELRDYFSSKQKDRARGGVTGIIRSRISVDIKRKGGTSRFVRVEANGLIKYTVR